MRAQYGCFGLGVLQEPDQLAWVGVDGELRAGFDVQSQPARERNHGLPAAQRRAGHDAKDGQVADAGGDFLRLHPPERAQCPPLIGCLRFATDAGVGMTKKQRNGFTSAGSRTLIPASSPQVADGRPYREPGRQERDNRPPGGLAVETQAVGSPRVERLRWSPPFDLLRSSAASGPVATFSHGQADASFFRASP